MAGLHLFFLTQFLLLIVQCTANLKTSDVGEWCGNSTFSCGQNALCLKEYCACEFGNIPSATDKEDCSELKCKSTKQCLQFFKNSKCSNNKCICEDSYILDNITQTCLKKVIGSNCSSSYDCGQFNNVFCFGNTCQCQMGDIPTDDMMDCQRMFCNKDRDCEKFGGAQCNYGSCKCQPNYYIDHQTQKCISSKVVVGEFCFNSNECGDYSLCLNHKCQCQMGFNATKSDVNCAKIKCRKDKECEDFGSAECNSGNCKCKPNYQINDDTQKCISSKVVVGGFCSNSNQCGDYSLCLNSFCLCQMGFNATKGDVNCAKVQCQKDKECEQLFGYAECESGQCECESGHLVDENTQKCIDKKMPGINEYCKDDSKCGNNAFCSKSKLCKCNFGYKVTSNNIDCTKMYCQSDKGCTDFFPNSHCRFTTCFCKPFYKLEDNICKKTSDDTDEPDNLSAGVIVIICLVPILCVAFCISLCCYCCRRQRNQATPQPRPVIILANPMQQRNMHFSGASAPVMSNNTTTTNQMYPDLFDPPPPYNPDYYKPQNKQ